MERYSFLQQVMSRGCYRSSGEASRATSAVFGTIKGWLSPAVSEQLRQQLNSEASQIWRFSPLAGKEVPSQFRVGVMETREATIFFMLTVQKVGGYKSLAEAKRAVSSVLSALERSLPVETVTLPGRAFMRKILGFPGRDELQEAGRAVSAA